DARHWFAYLCNRPEVDPERITIIGHSQGGTVALIMASMGDKVALRSMVLLATPGRTLHEILDEQIEDQTRKLGLDDAQRDRHLADFRELISNVKAGK